MGVCVFEGVFVRKSEKIYEKALPCAHISVFTRAIYEEKSRSHCALFIHDVFLHFSKGRERERERLIFVERTTLINKSTRRARAQNNETGNT